MRVSNKNRLVLIAIIMVAAGCAHQPHSEPVVRTKSGVEQVGLASWYGGKFAGRRTASGSRFNPKALTAAHRTLPFGTRVMVTNLVNDRQVEVVITDRGPFIRHRIIDLSKRAAQEIGMMGTGVARVRLDPLLAEVDEARGTQHEAR